MSKKSNRNALVHGVYSSDIILPWEKAEDFNELLKGIRLDFMPSGTTEDDIVFGIAVLHWKQRRINRAQQLAYLQSSVACEIEKSGKRSVSGIHRFLKAQRIDEARAEKQFPAAVVNLSESVAALARVATKNKKLSTSKLGSNLRGVISDVERLQPRIKAGATALAAAKPHTEEKVSDNVNSLDIITQDYEMEERLDASIEKKIKRLILIREFQRQYNQDSSPKLIEHSPSSAKGVTSKPTVAKAASRAQTKKSKGANDNWNNNENDDDNNDNVNPDNYDWEHEYDEALADKKKREERRARKD